jgi:signal transduction histidine kinase
MKYKNHKIIQFLKFIHGDSSNYSLEQRFFNASTFYLGIILLVITAINIALNLGVMAKLTLTFGSGFFFILHYLAKKGKYFNILVWIFILYSLFLASIIWLNNGGTDGPGNYSFIVLYAIILFVLKKIEKFIASVLIVVNILILYIIEMNNPEMIYSYQNGVIRTIDHLVSITLTLLVLYLTIRFAKDHYIKQKRIAEENNKLKTQFLANISHEIRTPLNGINGFSQLLRSEDLDSEKRALFVDTIISNSNQLLNIIENIVDISKIESNQVEINNISFNLNELLHETFVLFNEIAKPKNIDLKFKQDVDIKIITDKIKLQQVLANLLNNALKFTDEGEIEFGYEIRKDYLLFYVKDTGIGIKKGSEKLIFERFRKDSFDKKRIYEGTGLGLSISKSFINLLNGNLWVENNETQGCTFFFTLPNIEYSINDRNYNKQLIREQKERKELDLKGKKILIAEDEYSNYLYLFELLSDTNAKIFHATNGIEVLELTKDIFPDCILMDVKMPELDGFEATKIIKSKYPAIPVIAQTAFAFKGDEEKALRIGCNDFIAKPIDQDILFEKLSVHLLKQ